MSDYAQQAEGEMWDAIATMDRAVHAAPAASSSVKARTVEDWDEHYSPRNALILAASGATEVAGYKEWQKLGRQVRRGEHGIALNAPVVVKDRETGESKMVNVKTTTVFDVSQTDAIEKPFCGCDAPELCSCDSRKYRTARAV